MNKEHILLSVSMLISGRDEMEKSLNSLLYFKNAFPTEIILVDTGCNADQRALAEKYADKIINFTWCGDFAAARNVGLKEVHGEWFMFLDDDEWFDDPQEIISFFQSGEYREYNSASYVIRNYLDLQGTSYMTTYPSRMVKMQENTKFIGKIHEYLSPYEKPIKKFNDFVHHYGYAYKSKQEEVEHAWRNIEPLLEMRKEYPGKTRWMLQLAQEYFSVNSYDRTIESCKESLEEWKQYKNEVEYYPVHIGALYGYILFSLEALGRYYEEQEWLHKAFDEPINKQKAMEVSVIFYCLAGTTLYGQLEDNEKCLEYFKKYIDGLKKFKDDRELMETETAGIVSNVFHNIYYAEAVLLSLPALLCKKEYKLAKEAFERIDWAERNVFFRAAWTRRIIDTCCSIEFHPLCEEIIDKFAEGEGIHELYPIFRKLQSEYQRDKDDVKARKLRHFVAELDEDHFYVQASKIIWEREEGSRNVEYIRECFQRLLEKYPDHILEVEDKVWDIIKENQMNVAPLLVNMDYRIWRRNLESMEHWGSASDWKKWNERISAWKQEGNIRYDLFDIKYQEIELTEEIKEWVGLPKLEESLWLYAEKIIDFYEPYYKEEVLLENSVGLPDELQLALELKKQKEHCESGQNRKALEHLKNCLGIYPKLEKVMLTYAEMVRNRIQQQITEANEAQKELQQMVITLKNMAKQKLERGETVAAKAILSQVQQYAPDDDEIKTLLHNLEEKVK